MQPGLVIGHSDSHHSHLVSKSFTTNKVNFDTIIGLGVTHLVFDSCGGGHAECHRCAMMNPHSFDDIFGKYNIALLAGLFQEPFFLHYFDVIMPSGCLF